MNRRDFLRILLASAIAESVDVEQLLWTPKPIITVPGKVPFISESQIIMAEWERVGKHLPTLFERDNAFWEMISSEPKNIVSTRTIRIPLVVRGDRGRGE